MTAQSWEVVCMYQSANGPKYSSVKLPKVAALRLYEKLKNADQTIEVSILNGYGKQHARSKGQSAPF